MSCRRLALIGVIVCVCGPPAVSAQRESITRDLLDEYNRGNFAAVSDELRSIGDFRSALRQLDKIAVPWIRAEGPAAAGRRRLVAAGFALESAHAGLHQWDEARYFVEWACLLLRAGGLPSPPERAWHVAAVALAEGAHDPDLLTVANPGRNAEPRPLDHLRHSLFRFPDDDRLMFARLVIDEVRTLGSDPKHPDSKNVVDRETAQKLISASSNTPLPVLLSARRSLSLWDLADKLKVMSQRPGVRSEALARLANTYLRLARPDLAQHALEGATDTSDRSVAYLIQYLKATTYRTMGDEHAAQAAYRRALDEVPGAQSATIALSAQLFVGDSREAAYELMTGLFSRPDPVSDPWKEYQTGDFRFWPQRLVELRESYRR